MNRLLVTVFAFASFIAACADPAQPPATPTDGAKTDPMTVSSSGTPDATIAKEGEECGDGIQGRPKVICAKGLTCEMKVAETPPGKCRKEM